MFCPTIRKKILSDGGFVGDLVDMVEKLPSVVRPLSAEVALEWIRLAVVLHVHRVQDSLREDDSAVLALVSARPRHSFRQRSPGVPMVVVVATILRACSCCVPARLRRQIQRPLRPAAGRLSAAVLNGVERMTPGYRQRILFKTGVHRPIVGAAAASYRKPSARRNRQPVAGFVQRGMIQISRRQRRRN